MSKKKKNEPTLVINGKEYLESDLNAEQIVMLNMAKYIEPQIREYDQKLSILLDHKTRLVSELESSLEGSNEEATVIEAVAEKNN